MIFNNFKKINKAQIISLWKNPLTPFLVKGFVLFILWDQLLYNYFISPEIHNWVIYRLLDSSKYILNLFYSNVSIHNTNILINSINCVHVGIPCNGVDVMGVFACIVLAYKSKWYNKLWMVAVGIITVFMLNAIMIELIFYNDVRVTLYFFQVLLLI